MRTLLKRAAIGIGVTAPNLRYGGRSGVVCSLGRSEARRRLKTITVLKFGRHLFDRQCRDARCRTGPGKRAKLFVVVFATDQQ